MSNYKWGFAFPGDSEIVSEARLSRLILEEASGGAGRGGPGLRALGHSVEITVLWLHPHVM